MKGEIQFLGHTDNRHTYICPSRAASSQLKIQEISDLMSTKLLVFVRNLLRKIRSKMPTPFGQRQNHSAFCSLLGPGL